MISDRSKQRGATEHRLCHPIGPASGKIFNETAFETHKMVVILGVRKLVVDMAVPQIHFADNSRRQK